MPARNTLVLSDRQSTPVNHTFKPSSGFTQSGAVELTESSGVPIGDNRVVINVTSSDARKKVTVSGSFPIVQTQTVNGVSTPVVVRTARADISFSFDKSSLEQERKDAVGLMASVLDASKWTNDALTKLEGVW